MVYRRNRFIKVNSRGISMKIDKYECPDDLYYHKEHMWAKVEGDLVVVGITDFALQLAGEAKRIQTLEEDDEVEQDKPIGTISTGKWTGKLYAPVSGEIAEVNETVVEDEPKTVNDDTYGDGWILKIKPTNLDSELGNLMKIGDGKFEDWLKSEISKHAK
jgi:glycine cleavage system H protein